jgi:hypothetical protein
VLASALIRLKCGAFSLKGLLAGVIGFWIYDLLMKLDVLSYCFWPFVDEIEMWCLLFNDL